MLVCIFYLTHFHRITPTPQLNSHTYARAQCAQKAGKYTNKFRTNQTFRLIFRHLAILARYTTNTTACHEQPTQSAEMTKLP